MKASFACNNDLPGDIILSSETPEEMLLFRIFTNWPCNTGKELILTVKSQGGTESKRDILIGWKEQESKEL